MKKLLFALICVSLLSLTAYADDAIVAKVNGKVLTMKDLERELDRLIPQITFHRQVPPEKRKNYYKQALESLIDRELEYQDAVSQGMKPDKKAADAELEKIKSRFKTPEDYKAALKKQGLTEAAFRAVIEKEFLLNAIVRKTVVDHSQISDAELKEYYEKHTSSFKKPESVKLSLITTKDEKKASEILKKLKSGEDFGQVAKTMSEDGYSSRGGDIGYVHKGTIAPEIEKVAFSLSAGEFSEPIHVENFWYIVKVDDKKPSYAVPFEEIKGKLKQQLESDKARTLQEKWIASLKKKAAIETFLK